VSFISQFTIRKILSYYSCKIVSLNETTSLNNILMYQPIKTPCTSEQLDTYFHPSWGPHNFSSALIDEVCQNLALRSMFFSSRRLQKGQRNRIIEYVKCSQVRLYWKTGKGSWLLPDRAPSQQMFRVIKHGTRFYLFVSVFFYLARQPPSGPGPPLSRGFYTHTHTHNDAPQSVGLLWTSDKLIAHIST
jgi:hypothetical protein